MSNAAGVLMWQVFLWVMSEAVYQYSVESADTLKFSYLQLKSFCIFKSNIEEVLDLLVFKFLPENCISKIWQSDWCKIQTQDHAMDQNPMLELTDLWC